MEIQKASFTFILFCFLTTLCWQPEDTAALYGGAWCPYKREKFVPCRVHNGTESYLGPNICWKNFNGTYSCTKRMLVRPKFVNTYKKVFETIYVPNCHQECFNCSTIHVLENRLGYLEKKINQIQVLSPLKDVDDKTFGSGQNHVRNSISDDDDDQDLDLDTLNIVNDMRGLETRLVNVESQLAKLMHSIKQEFLQLKSTTDNSIAIVRPQQPQEEKAQESSQVPIITTTTTEKITTSSTPAVDKQTMQRLRGRDGHHHKTTIRLLDSNKEPNLDRGDIPSTLNDGDDYGEDAISSPSNEEYADQLYTHEHT